MHKSKTLESQCKYEKMMKFMYSERFFYSFVLVIERDFSEFNVPLGVSFCRHFQCIFVFNKVLPNIFFIIFFKLISLNAIEKLLPTTTERTENKRDRKMENVNKKIATKLNRENTVFKENQGITKIIGYVFDQVFLCFPLFRRHFPSQKRQDS